MASKKMDDCGGLYGGCMTSGNGTPCDDNMPDFGACRQIGLPPGGGTEYLGHFSKEEYLREGHNTIQEPGLWPMQIDRNLQPQPQQAAGGQGPIGSAINKAIGAGALSLLGGLL